MSDPSFDLAEFTDTVRDEVASRHQRADWQCTCGFESYRNRDHSEHIIDATLAAAGLLEPDPKDAS